MTPSEFLAFTKEMDSFYDTAIENGDEEVIQAINWVDCQANREGKTFHVKLYEVLNT